MHGLDSQEYKEKHLNYAMGLSDLIEKFPDESSLSAHPRPYVNHSVQMKKPFTAKDRSEMLENVGLNVFFFPSEMITGCDLLSDSGTTTMTNEQWAALHMGDEAYGSNTGYFVLGKKIRDTFGEGFFPDAKTPHGFIFHQGRPAEDALFTLIGNLGPDLIIPSNGHFDTTQANIQANKIKAVNFFSPDLSNGSTFHFKGNMDTAKLKACLETSKSRIPLVFLTITNNTGGGQPVSMDNIQAVSALCRQFNTPLFFDACRFAENAWFIKQHERGYRNKPIRDIVKEMFSHVDGFTISFKKDGYVNMGGGLFLKEGGLFVKKYPHILDALVNYQILKEGHPTYGGLSGRDIMSLSIGLDISKNENLLTHRIDQVQAFGKKMRKDGIPVLTPTGGHAVYLDVNAFFGDTAMKPDGFGGVSLSSLLLGGYGHRAIELGYFAFGSFDKTAGENVFPEINFLRFAVPRLRYETQDLNAVAEAMKSLHENRMSIPPVKVTYGRDLPLRHFKARFEFTKIPSMHQ